MKEGSDDPFSTLFTGSITAKIGGSIMPIIDDRSDLKTPVENYHPRRQFAGKIGEPFILGDDVYNAELHPGRRLGGIIEKAELKSGKLSGIVQEAGL